MPTQHPVRAVTRYGNFQARSLDAAFTTDVAENARGQSPVVANEAGQLFPSKRISGGQLKTLRNSSRAGPSRVLCRKLTRNSNIDYTLQSCINYIF